MPKPVILVTLYRRYFELEKNLQHIHDLKHEFREEPEIVVVWAIPEVGHLWFMNKLLEQKRVHHVVGRPKLFDEEPGKATTYPESHNLRVGLEFIRKNYPDAYVIGQTADIQPLPGSYRFIDNKIHEGERAVVYHFEGGCRTDIWHTNFFAVTDEAYWPPISAKNSDDILERQWGLCLAEKRVEGLFRWHNSRNQSFLHEHLSETQPELKVVPVFGDYSISLTVKGYVTFWQWLSGKFGVRRKSK